MFFLRTCSPWSLRLLKCTRGASIQGVAGAFPVPGVFAAQTMREAVYDLFNAFIINMLNLDIRKNVTIFDERIVIKGNGVRGVREAWNAGGSVAGRAAGVRAHAGNRPGGL